ncbi:MAG: glycosyltransferase family 2 protein [Mariniphaga sp.]
MPLVSIGIPTYNRAALLDRLLQNITHQTYKQIEIIISDNFSPDNMVSEVIKKYAESDLRIIAFRQKANLGLIANHQFVQDQSKGKYFMWAHDDDEFPENYVEVCVGYLQNNSGATLVGPSADRYMDRDFWSTYENWDSRGLNTYVRLKNLMEDAFVYHWRFEQYFSGLWLLALGPKKVSADFKTLFYHFFVLSEAGELLHAPELKLIKHTDQENIKRYSTGELYRKHWLLKFFGWNNVESVQQCVPITLQMLRTIIGSKRLNMKEKYKLIAQCVRLFVRYPIKDEFIRIKNKYNFKRIKRIPNWISRKFKSICGTILKSIILNI